MKKLFNSRSVATTSYIANISLFATLANHRAFIVAGIGISCVLIFLLYQHLRKIKKKKSLSKISNSKLRMKWYKKYEKWTYACIENNYIIKEVDDGYIATDPSGVPVGYFSNTETHRWLLIKDKRTIN